MISDKLQQKINERVIRAMHEELNEENSRQLEILCTIRPYIEGLEKKIEELENEISILKSMTEK